MADLTTLLSKFLQNLSFYSGGVSGALTVSSTTSGNTASAAEENLWTYSLPANTLSATNKLLRVTAFGTLGATANTKSVRLYFGSTLVCGDNTTENAGNWRIWGTVIRTGAATQLALGHGERSASALFEAGRISTPAETLSSAVTIKVTGQSSGSAANDVVVRGVIVELLN